MKIGYARVSSTDQNLDRQLNKLNEMGCEKVYKEKISGKDINRPEFQKLMAFCREGDVIVIESISRLARNTHDLLRTVEQLESSGVGLVSCKESIDTTSPQGRFVLTIFAALSELERSSIKERQREGIEIAKKAGKYKGRAKAPVDMDELRSVCQRWRSGDISATEAMKLSGISKSRFYRLVKEHNL